MNELAVSGSSLQSFYVLKSCGIVGYWQSNTNRLLLFVNCVCECLFSEFSQFPRRNWEEKTPCCPIFKEFPLVLSGRENKIKTTLLFTQETLGCSSSGLRYLSQDHPCKELKPYLIYPLNYRFAFL